MKEWDMIRFILFASLFLCLAGVGLYFYQVNDLRSLEDGVPSASKRLNLIGKVSAEVDLRIEELLLDKRHGVELRKYVANQARNAGINYTNELEFKQGRDDPHPRDGYLDSSNEIKPIRKKKFHRRTIAKFIFNLEVNTNRLKVTELSLDKPGPAFENWEMLMQVTERKPMEARNP